MWKIATGLLLTGSLALCAAPSIAQERSVGIEDPKSSGTAGKAEEFTAAGELARMAGADHLYRPQVHRLVQYSGFSRKGSNPDSGDYLYKEDGWRVMADQEGPGIVSRIWMARKNWSEIKVEIDGQVVFSGKPDKFFCRDKLPFAEPLVSLLYRGTDEFDETLKNERKDAKKRLVCYVPIGFQKRFPFMQRHVDYTNINIKVLPADAKVQPFADVDWDALKEPLEQVAKVWRRVDLGGDLSAFEAVRKSVTIAPAQPGREAAEPLAELKGPGIIRAIRIKAADPNQMSALSLRICWDGQAEPAVDSPLGVGLGSLGQRTLALGQSEDGWRFCALPMPFRKSAAISLVSDGNAPASAKAEVYVQRNAQLPDDVLYLHSHANAGQFIQDKDKFAQPDLPLEDFYYHNGYTALDRKGSGHIVAYMDLFQCQPELDEHVFIDDERKFPGNSWNGTGHEDLFDMAWGHWTLTSPITSGGSQTFEEVNVKLFWNDPMTFRTAIRWNWEWAFRYGVNPPRDARFSSVVYWYQ